MPAAYDTTSRRFDDLMAEVCPHSREETRQRIEAWRRDRQFELSKLKDMREYYAAMLAGTPFTAAVESRKTGRPI